MPTKIRITEQDRAAALQRCADALNAPQSRSLSNKLKFEIDLNHAIEATPPHIYLTPQAYIKINALIQSTNDEIAWHATLTRINENKHDYILDDVFVFPQTVSATGFTVDETELAKWQAALPDNVFNKLRVFAHSHVNMAVYTSSTDLNTYEKFLQNFSGSTGFYLFLIINKRWEIHKTFYDFAQNAIFDDKEITIDTLLPTDATTLQTWYAFETKDKIKKNALPIIKQPEHYSQPYYDDGYGYIRNYTTHKPTNLNNNNTHKTQKKAAPIGIGGNARESK